MNEDLPPLGDLIHLSERELVVAGLRNAQRLIQCMHEELPGVDVLHHAVVLADRVLRGISRPDTLHDACEAAYRVAGRMAGEWRKSSNDDAARRTIAVQAIHLSIDAVADFDVDPYSSVHMTNRSLELSQQLGIRELMQELLRDIELIQLNPRLCGPDRLNIDAFGPLWQAPHLA